MRTLAQATSLVEEVRKSRFLGFASPVTDIAEALSFVESCRDTTANHTCWAYRVGDEYRFTDDGEPSGSAGKPMLAAIDGHDLDHVCVVVVRFFGGIKLGVGGLMRAYGGCASRTLDAGQIVTLVPRKILRIQVPFEHINPVYQIMDEFDATKQAEEYVPDGIQIAMDVAEKKEKAVLKKLMDATSGAVQKLSDNADG